MPQVVDYVWTVTGHVDPPDARNDEDRQLFYYLGPNLYPAGLYMPQGYDLESRDGEEGWVLFRARDTLSGQIMTIWALGPEANDVQVLDA